MKQNTLWIIVGVVVIALISFVALQPKTDTEEAEAVIEKPAEVMMKKEVVLSEQNDSGESGTATLTEENGQVKVIVNLVGAPAEAQPAHIHTGSCPTPGDVKYPLTNVVAGTSETMLDVTLYGLNAQMPLAINVHMSTDDLKTYVACGNLEL